jgi:hypothetical protein
MELHVQKCQACQSRDLRNVLVRDEKQYVYVQCRDCGEFVARYILASGGYFHAGKGYESFLRSIERDGGITSARESTLSFESTEQEALKEFDQVKEWMQDKYGDKLP